MASNSSTNTSQLVLTENKKLNTFFISIDECSKQNPKFYCHYLAFLILTGYVCLSLVFPFTLYRMNKLNKRFRNQYNLSLLWICSILLITTIDLQEFVYLQDEKLYSITIVLLMLLNICSGIVLSIKYMKTYSKDGSVYKHSLTILFSLGLFVILFFGRLFTKNRLSKFRIIDSKTYHLVNTHMFLYYFVYILFGFVQVHQNFRKNIARCFSNASYASWIFGSFLLSFYSSILPKYPIYDFVHYRNYFLMTTIIIIIFQDLNLYRTKRAEKHTKTALSKISIKQFKTEVTDTVTSNVKKFKNFRFTDNAFESEKNLTSNQDDEVCFDVRQYKNKNELNSNDVNLNTSVPELILDNDLSQSEQDVSRIEEFYQKNQNFLLIVFVVLLSIKFIVSTYVMINSTSRSIYQLLTLLIHPFNILLSKILNRYDVNLFKH